MKFGFLILLARYNAAVMILFTGKSEFLRGNFSLETPLSCCCDLDLSYRNMHKKSFDTCSTFSNVPDVPKADAADVKVVPTTTDQNVDLVDPLIDSVAELTIEESSDRDCVSPQVPAQSSDHDDLLAAPSQCSNHQLFPSEPFHKTESIPTSSATQSDPHTTAVNGYGVNLNANSANHGLSSPRNLEEVLQSTLRMLDEQCEFLEAFIRHTTDEGVVTENASTSSDHDLASENITGIEHSFEECTESLLMHLDSLNNDAECARTHLIKIIEQSYDDVDVSHHVSYQRAAKAVVVSVKQILMILDKIVRHFEFTPIDLVDQFGYEQAAQGIQQLLVIISHFRDRLIQYVYIVGQVQKEIKRNELLRLRLLNSLELEAIQREELTKIRNLNEQLSALHDQHEAVFRQMNCIITNSGDLNPEQIPENAPIIDVEDSSSDSEITDEEVYDENSPELVSLLKSEAKLLLEHAKYSHCPRCCPYAYTPRLEQLDITDINYQSVELAGLTLKGFLTVNEGLKLLNLSWSCVDNELVSFLLTKMPKALNISFVQLFFQNFMLGFREQYL